MSKIKKVEPPAPTLLHCPAKINLGLHVGPLDPDGFHPIQTIFLRTSLYDHLYIKPASTFSLSCSDPSIPNDARNLIAKAYKAYFAKVPSPPAYEIHLHKSIPWGAGFGGGSSNAAEFLKFLHQQNIPATPGFSELLVIAKELGSDIPFFMHSGSYFAEGRGELLSPLGSVPTLPIILAGTATPLATAKIFRIYDSTSPVELTLFPVSQVYKMITENNGWGLKNFIRNDLQAVVEKEWPEMLKVRTLLENSGADFVSMSGSGFVYFGIYSSVQIRDLALQTLKNELPFVEGVDTL